MRFVSRLAAVIAFFLSLGTLAFAQSATTSVHGTISDAKGAVVVGATVTISDPATGLSRTVTTGAQGEYQFLELPPATYELTVKAHGFATVKERGVQLLVRSPATVNVTVEVSGGIETVEVNATTTLVNTEMPRWGTPLMPSKFKLCPLKAASPPAF